MHPQRGLLQPTLICWILLKQKVSVIKDVFVGYIYIFFYSCWIITSFTKWRHCRIMVIFSSMIVTPTNQWHYVKTVIFVFIYSFSLWFQNLKDSQLGAFCPWAIVYCYLEFKLLYLNNLKLFPIGVKEVFKHIV